MPARRGLPCSWPDHMKILGQVCQGFAIITAVVMLAGCAALPRDAFEDAELLVEKRRWLRRRGLFGFVGCGGCFMRGLGGRGGRIETQRRARNVFHRGLHLGFVIGIGPDVIPYVLGPVGPIGDGDFLMHVGRQA